MNRPSADYSKAGNFGKHAGFEPNLRSSAGRPLTEQSLTEVPPPSLGGERRRTGGDEEERNEVDSALRQIDWREAAEGWRESDIKKEFSSSNRTPIVCDSRVGPLALVHGLY